MTDKYLTLSANMTSEGYYTSKHSRFYAFAHHVESAQEAMDFVDSIKKKYHDAHRFCYAYRLGFNGEETKLHDDGEPSSCAGRPIIGQLVKYGVTNSIIVVIRYWGGVLLGTGGLMSAYKEAASAAMKDAEIENRYVEDTVCFSFTYPMMKDVTRIIRETGARVVRRDFGIGCSVTLKTRRSMTSTVKDRLDELDLIYYGNRKAI